MKISKRKILIACGIVIVGLAAIALWQRRDNTTTSVNSERKKSAVTVRATEARQGSIQAWIFAEGTVRSARREYLTFENPGRVTFIQSGSSGNELREGDLIKANTLLAQQDQRQSLAEIRTFESSLREAQTQLAVARAELVQARTDETLARTTFERFAVLVKQKSASLQEYDEAQAQAAKAQAASASAESQITAAQARVEAAESRLAQAKVEMEETELRSPIDGVVAYLNIKKGYYFMPSLVRTDDETAALQTVPMVVIDPSVFEVTVKVPAYERQRIKPGQTVLIATSEQNIKAIKAGQQDTADKNGEKASAQIAQLPESPVRGEVFSVNPAISPGGRAIQVKIRTAEGARRLEDGMFVTVWIATEQRENIVVAPMNVFTYQDNQPFVFVVDRKTNTAELQPVTLGLQGFGVQQILSGVEAGDLLVTDGRFQLSDGAHIRLLPDTEIEAPKRANHE